MSTQKELIRDSISDLLMENDIDLSRAQRAKERAEERLKNKSSIDIDRANKALERAKARLRINN